MKANKRTVWFLTLISLVAVISIFYISNKSPMPFDGLALFDKSELAVTNDKVEETNKQEPVFAESYIFDDRRMTVRNERSELKEQLTTKVTSSDFTSAEKNEAMDAMAELTKRDAAEALLEMQIIALGYPDAFVHAESGLVRVTVLTQDSQSTKQADEITYLVMSNWEEARKVNVIFEAGS